MAGIVDDVEIVDAVNTAISNGESIGEAYHTAATSKDIRPRLVVDAYLRWLKVGTEYKVGYGRAVYPSPKPNVNMTAFMIFGKNDRQGVVASLQHSD